MVPGYKSYGSLLLGDFEVGGSILAPLIDDVKADALAFRECAQTGLLDSADVNEHILTATAVLNKTEALLGIKPFDCSVGHFGLLKKRISACSTLRHCNIGRFEFSVDLRRAEGSARRVF